MNTPTAESRDVVMERLKLMIDQLDINELKWVLAYLDARLAGQDPAISLIDFLGEKDAAPIIAKWRAVRVAAEAARAPQ